MIASKVSHLYLLYYNEREIHSEHNGKNNRNAKKRTIHRLVPLSEVRSLENS